MRQPMLSWLMRVILGFTLLFVFAADSVGARQEQALPPTIWELDWSSDGSLLAGANSDGNVYIWDRSGELLRVLSGHNGHVANVDWKPNNHIIASSGVFDDFILIWNADTGQILQSIEAPKLVGGIFLVRWNRDGSKLFAASGDTFQVWETTNWTPVTRTFTGTIYDALWSSSDDSVLIAGLYDLDWLSFDPPSDSREIDPNYPPVAALSWSPDKQTFAAVGRTRPFLSLWTPYPLAQTVVTHLSAQPSDVAFLDATHVAVATQGGLVWVINPQTGETIEQYTYGSEVNTIAWNPVYGILAAGGISSEQPGEEDGLVGLVQPASIPTPTPTNTPTPTPTATPSVGTVQLSGVPAVVALPACPPFQYAVSLSQPPAPGTAVTVQITYSAPPGSGTAINILPPGTWMGFLNRNWDVEQQGDPSYPGDARFDWINTIITVIFREKGW